jgi:ribonuclease P protein component
MDSPSPEDLRFPKSAKVLRAEDFRRVRAARRSVRDDVLELQWAKREPGPARFGTIVPVRGLGSVGRNRVKRVLRELFRLRRATMPDGYDLVASPRDRLRARDFAAAAASFDALLRRFRERERLT